MIGSVLIANRGEIARRIIRTARRMGVRAVAVYSDADSDAPHVREADAAIRIGPAAAQQSYLDGAAIIAAATRAGAEAVHPGYGFLSENADFAEAVIGAGLVWVGPPPAAIRAMGLKDAAKRLMAEAGVPTTPGYLGDDQTDVVLAREATAIGWPVMIKAIAGGGGKGMRRVDRASDFAGALEAARREALAAFGDHRVLLERFVARPRHIEVQVFGDAHGNFVHLFERDCSAQRRHQKVIEEAPAPGMDEAVRQAVCATALRAAKAVAYVGAGTVEFIADASEGLRADRIWFMEMNTRLQVEHPVTEAVTGLDLVEWQLEVASGEPLPLRQDQIRCLGHAIEARLYAEDPAAGFLPSSGPLQRFRLPAGIRVDAGVEQGGRVTPFYDPMVAKLVAHGETRAAATLQLARACEAVECWPVRTNAGFLARTLRTPEFRAGEVDTGLIEARLGALAGRPPPSEAALCAAATALAGLSDGSPWSGLAGFRMARGPAAALIECEGTAFPARAAPSDRSIHASGGEAVVFEAGEAYAFSRPGAETAPEGEAGEGEVRAPMPGRVAQLWVKAGESVRSGQKLVAIEAMKMEQALVAPFDGRVAEAPAKIGAQVSEGDLLMRLEPAS